jgi:hypothetical protein
MTTDSRTGFRAPWSTDQDEDEAPGAGPDSSDARGGSPSDGFPARAADASSAPTARVNPWASAGQAPPAGGPAPAGRQAQFLLELRRAMQQAAESAREESLARFQVEAKTIIEAVHSQSAEGAEALRHRAEEDVAAIREWSKAEIARIRDEAESRISGRRLELETQVERHAAVIEREIERIHRRGEAFESEMATFFEHLFAEDDPARFAMLARNLPEPPAMEVDPGLAAGLSWSSPDVEDRDGSADEPTNDGFQVAGEAGEAVDDAAAVDREDAPLDPRLVALGLTSDDAAAAEAEALASIDEVPADDEIVAIDDSALAARLAGLVPMGTAADGSAHGTASTRVVVVGLVSVSSIAGFKRQLSRTSGVQTVGVSSTAEGDFIFDVTHQAGVDMAAVVPTLAEFRPVVGSIEGDTVHVTATDPGTAD